ncbi:GNAT family N-acetyltransferase [Colwelliaceae bacterium BS250]
MININHSVRLTFSLMDESDADLLYQLDQDPAVMRYINGGVTSSMVDIKEKFIPRMQSYRNADKYWGLWKVTITETNNFIGWILLRPMNFFTAHPQTDNIEIGWRFMKKSWGKGYASEAALHFKNVLTANTAVKQLSAIAMSGNKASIQVMKKLGMSYLKDGSEQLIHEKVDITYYQLNIDRNNNN